MNIAERREILATAAGEERPRRAAASAPHSLHPEHRDVHGNGESGAAMPEHRWSADPMGDTDRYRLVTPYLSSSREA